MNIQTFVAQRSVERLDERVIRRLAWSREVDPGSVMIRPQINEMTSKFRAIVGKEIFWRAALSNEAVQNFHDMFAAQALPNLDRQCLAAEDVDHRQRAELLAIAELVVDEVEAPGFVRSPGLTTRLPMNDHLASARPFAA
jgi:hypothetical protein